MRPKKGESKEEFITRMEDKTKAEQIWNNSCPTAVCSGNSVFEVVAHSQSGYSVTTNQFEGNSFLVVPCILIKEGVHNGSAGSVFYPGEEIEKFPSAWNGRPAPLNHPSVNGVPVSCNSPQVLELNNLGFIFNANAVAGTLKAELWLNQNRLTTKAPDILKKIQDKQPVEVSTGLYFEMEETVGVWNGESYDGIARNFRPDHLAILGDAPGACSVADGCGIRANQAANFFVVCEDEKSLVVMTPNTNKKFHVVHNGYEGEVSFSDIRSMAWKALEAGNEKGVWFYLEEVGFSYLIYEKNVEGLSSTYYKVDYELNKDKTEVIITGTPVEVVLIREYKVKNNGGILMNREQLVEKLKGFGFAVNEGSTMTDGELSSILENLEKKEAEKVAALKVVAKEKMKEEEEKKEEKKTVVNTKMTVDDWLTQAPTPIRDMVANSIRRENDYRQNLIQGIVANEVAKGLFTENDLKAKSTDDLEKLANLAMSAVKKEKVIVDNGTMTDYSFMNLTSNAGETKTPEPLAVLSLFDPAK